MPKDVCYCASLYSPCGCEPPAPTHEQAVAAALGAYLRTISLPAPVIRTSAALPADLVEPELVEIAPCRDPACKVQDHAVKAATLWLLESWALQEPGSHGKTVAFEAVRHALTVKWVSEDALSKLGKFLDPVATSRYELERALLDVVRVLRF